MNNEKWIIQTKIRPLTRTDFSLCWHRPIFPGRFQPSIFGTDELNFCVRNGNRWTLTAIGTNFLRYGLPPSLYIKQVSLSYAIIFIFLKMVTRTRFELVLPAWEAGVLGHLTNGPRLHLSVFTLGANKNGAPSGTRTRDTLIKSQVLYQLS